MPMVAGVERLRRVCDILQCDFSVAFNACENDILARGDVAAKLCEILTCEAAFDDCGIDRELRRIAPLAITERHEKLNAHFGVHNAAPEITEADIPVFRLDGKAVEKPREPSMELFMHLNIYRSRPDVNAVIHTHSPALIRLAEAEVNHLGIPTAPVYPVGSRELAEGCIAHMGKAPAVLLKGHGAVMTGVSLEEAFRRALDFENAANNIYKV